MQGMKKMENQLWELEEQFWLGGTDFYTTHLTDDAVMLFAQPVGLLQRDEIIETINNAPRWIQVEMTNSLKTKVHDEVTILTYQADARRRSDEDPYRVQVISVYRRVDDRWLLAFHQQIPTQNQTSENN